MSWMNNEKNKKRTGLRQVELYPLWKDKKKSRRKRSKFATQKEYKHFEKNEVLTTRETGIKK